VQRKAVAFLATEGGAGAPQSKTLARRRNASPKASRSRNLTVFTPYQLQPVRNTLRELFSAMKEILLVEDSRSDADHLQRSLKSVGVVNPVRWIWDGTQALTHLEQAELTAAIAPAIPSILFLDLKLPGVSGFEILKHLQGRAVFNEMLCIALSQITDLHSIKRAYGYGAYSFLSKPIQLVDLRDLIRSFPGYWMFGSSPDRMTAPAAALSA
jgi:CheY-like chemotaxis protein